MLFRSHVAGVTKGVRYEDFQAGNVMPTRNLALAAAEALPGLTRFVMVSSLAAYGPALAGEPLREEDPPRPVEFYGDRKSVVWGKSVDLGCRRIIKKKK